MKNQKIPLTALLVVALVMQAYPCTTTTTLPTDCSMKHMTIVSDTNTLVNGNPAVATWVYPGWPSITGATWIWTSYRLDSESKFGPYSFIRDFTLPENAQQITGTVKIDADNAYNIYLNGNLIGNDGYVSNPPILHTQDPREVSQDYRWKYVKTHSFTPTAGDNEIKIDANNYRGWVNPDTNPAGVIYRVDIDYAICPTTTTTPTTSTTSTSTTSTTTTTRPVSECPNPVIPIKSLQGISSISFVEQTVSFSTNTFPIGSTALNYGTVDLSTTALENYDYYISDADGTPDAQGSYVSSVCNRNLYLGGIRSGHNLDSISLNLGCGSKIYADHVASYELGNSPYDSGYTQNILGPTDGKITYLGDGRSRITVGFCDALTTTTTSSTTSTTTSSTTTTIPCKNLWWFDNDHPFCQNNTFCGAYMYLGLRTFETKEECEGNLPTTTTTCHVTTTTCPVTTTTTPVTTTTAPPATTTTSTSTTTTTIPCISGLKIRARGESSAGVAPIMQLWIDGKLKAQWNVLDSVRDYSYDYSLGTAGHNIDVVYTNNCETATTDRNLYVYQVQAGCTVMQPTDSGVKYDKGVGNAAFDGLDVVPGQAEMYWSGALRFKTNGGYVGTTTTTTTTSVTTTTIGQCTLVGDYPKCGEVTLMEVLALITKWANGQATIQQILTLITAYSRGA